MSFRFKIPMIDLKEYQKKIKEGRRMDREYIHKEMDEAYEEILQKLVHIPENVDREMYIIKLQKRSRELMKIRKEIEPIFWYA